MAAMVADSDPRNYTYEDAVKVLKKLDFQLAPSSGTSHRKWRYAKSGSVAVVIGLVDKGSGTLKPYLIRDMVRQLKDNGLVPADIHTPGQGPEDDDDVD